MIDICALVLPASRCLCCGRLGTAIQKWGKCEAHKWGIFNARLSWLVGARPWPRSEKRSPSCQVA